MHFLMVGLAVKRPTSRTTCTNLGVILTHVPPILSRLHAISQDELLLVLHFFCFETFDNPMKALHYDFELDQFIAINNFPGLVCYPLHCEKVFATHVTLDFVIDFIWQLINEFVLRSCCQRGCLDVFNGKVLLWQQDKLPENWPTRDHPSLVGHYA